MPAVRIDLRRLLIVYSAVIFGPLALGFILDLFIDVDFSLVVFTGFVSLPLAVFFVCRIALAEMDRVVQIVAPLEESESTD